MQYLNAKIDAESIKWAIFLRKVDFGDRKIVLKSNFLFKVEKKKAPFRALFSYFFPVGVFCVVLLLPFPRHGMPEKAASIVRHKMPVSSPVNFQFPP